MTSSAYFDKAYYDRFYRDAATRAVSPEEASRRADFVCAYCQHLGLRLRRVLDLGCGLGSFGTQLARHYPQALYTGVEYSSYLCQTYGWTQGSVEDFRARTPFDLVVCYDVLQYLEDEAAERALENLTRLSRGALFFGVLTDEDWDQNCDQDRTDGAVHVRSAEWYRERLRPMFVNAGGGLFVRRDAGVILWEIESLP
ncbi:MAG: class I SAM-dependent methyltransferase [Gammaproteobacteria bacterium]|nr:class I SAM-dependent methyltransferase [Gammaproteobacteria bacterium]